MHAHHEKSKEKKKGGCQCGNISNKFPAKNLRSNIFIKETRRGGMLQAIRPKQLLETEEH
jgi:hypothetical protein